MAATGGINAGTTITVSTVRDNEHLPIEILSSVSIARGASAVIYKGELKLPNTTYTVALKVFPILLREHEQEMLRRELKALSRVSHNCVLPLIGTSNLGGRTIIVTPFMRNGNMLQYLKARPGVDRRGLIIQVAEAVYFLHVYAGVVHGDLKCENVLVSNSGNALVADFGLSAIIDKEESSATTMSAIRDRNTLRFAAPELLLGPEDGEIRVEGHRGPRSKTRESDVYAFGMLVLQAFTEKPPWYPLRNEAVLTKVVNRVTPAHPGPDLAHLGLSTAWWDVCHQCWGFDPRLRPAMNQVWSELKQSSTVQPDDGLSVRRDLRFQSGYHNGGGIHSVSWVPGGTRIISSSATRIQVWDYEPGLRLRARVTGVGRTLCDKFLVSCVAISPDGLQIAASGENGTIRLCDALSGALLGQLSTGGHDRVYCIAYSPDGRHIAADMADDSGSIICFDTSTGAGTRSPECSIEFDLRRPVLSIAFSPDGRRIAFGSWGIRIWDIATSDHSYLPVSGARGRPSICFLPNGRHIVSSHVLDGAKIYVWDAATLQLVHTMHAGDSAYITAIAASPLGKYIASASENGTIRIWDAEAGEPVATLPIHSKSFGTQSVAFSSNGKSVATGCLDGNVRVWDVFD